MATLARRCVTVDTYGEEDYPYTPAPEIDDTVVLTEGAG